MEATMRSGGKREGKGEGERGAEKVGIPGGRGGFVENQGGPGGPLGTAGKVMFILGFCVCIIIFLLHER